MASSPGPRCGARKPKTELGRRFWSAYDRLFCKRTIIVISDHKTQHVPFSARFQLIGTLATVGFIVWASYSSGSYMAAQQLIAEKERRLSNYEQENGRVTAEFNLLKNDLMKLAAANKSGKNSEFAKMIAEQYSDKQVARADDDSDAHSEYDAVFKRIEFLENKVNELQTSHNEMIADIRAATGSKIQEIERVIARVGVDKDGLQRAAEIKRQQEEVRKEKYGRIDPALAGPSTDKGGQGGPFEPVPHSVLKEKETDLYFNLRRLMVLNEIVHAMPLEKPLAGDDFRITSGFGVRSDPFRGSSAFHSGLDLVGPEHARVLATNDGKVEFAGWKAAYGNVVDIKHEFGFVTRYAHLERVLVAPEQVVKKGQAIGIQGSTGRSTGHHLHYEVRYQGQALNPLKFLRAEDDDV